MQAKTVRRTIRRVFARESEGLGVWRRSGVPSREDPTTPLSLSLASTTPSAGLGASLGWAGECGSGVAAPSIPGPGWSQCHGGRDSNGLSAAVATAAALKLAAPDDGDNVELEPEGGQPPRVGASPVALAGADRGHAQAQTRPTLTLLRPRPGSRPGSSGGSRSAGAGTGAGPGTGVGIGATAAGTPSHRDSSLSALGAVRPGSNADSVAKPSPLATQAVQGTPWSPALVVLAPTPVRSSPGWGGGHSPWPSEPGSPSDPSGSGEASAEAIGVLVLPGYSPLAAPAGVRRAPRTAQEDPEGLFLCGGGDGPGLRLDPSVVSAPALGASLPLLPSPLAPPSGTGTCHSTAARDAKLRACAGPDSPLPPRGVPPLRLRAVSAGPRGAHGHPPSHG